MEANTMISYITGSFAAIGILAFFVAVIVQTVKELPVLKKLPTSVVALVVSLILCPFSLLAFCAYAGESVTWYFICASVLAAFPVYLVATGGWERLRDIWERTKYKEGFENGKEKCNRKTDQYSGERNRLSGKENTKKLLKHYPYVYCPNLGNLFTKYANPKVGDVVIFWRNNTFAHTGIVISVYGDRFETIEGNTSGASGIIPNGGGVCRKSYYNSRLPGTKFCRPDYSTLEKEEDSSECLSKFPKWTGRVTASSLNVRQWAGTEYPKLKSCPVLSRGKTVEICDIVKANNGENWYYVRINGKIYGFVCGQYIEKISCFLYRWKSGTLRI